MRNISIPVFALIACMAISCSGGGNSPEKTVDQFLKAIDDRNWEEAKKYATPESESMIDMVKGFADMMPDTSSSKMNSEVIKDKTKVEGETAEVFTKDENGNEMAYKLKKIDGKWKVDFTMEALMGDMAGGVVDQGMGTMEGMGDSITIEGDAMMDTARAE